MRGPIVLALLAISARAAPRPAEGDPFLRRTTTVRVGGEGRALGRERHHRAARVAAEPVPPVRGDPFFDRFFRTSSSRACRSAAQSLGSGVLIDAQRHVLTNEHVVAARGPHPGDASPTAASSTRKLIGADPNNDLAVLEVETQETLPWIAPGSLVAISWSASR